MKSLKDIKIHIGFNVILSKKSSWDQPEWLDFVYELTYGPYYPVSEKVSRFFVFDHRDDVKHYSLIQAKFNSLIKDQKDKTNLEQLNSFTALVYCQNPTILDRIWILDDVEITRKTFIREIELDNGEIYYRHLTVDEAEDFQRAYQSGIQHVSEILISNGLW